MMPSGEDAAIKRVLQDKRFKVRGRSPKVDLVVNGASLTFSHLEP